MTKSILVSASLLIATLITIGCAETEFKGGSKAPKSSNATPPPPVLSSEIVLERFRHTLTGNAVSGPSYAVFLRDTSSSMRGHNRTYGDTTVQGILTAAAGKIAGVSFCANGGTKTGAVYNSVNALRARLSLAGGASIGSCPTTVTSNIAALAPGTRLGIIVFSDWGPGSFNFSNSEAALAAFLKTFETVAKIASAKLYWIYGNTPAAANIAHPYFQAASLGQFFSYTDSPAKVIDEVATNLSTPVVDGSIPLPTQLLGLTVDKLAVILDGTALTDSQWSLVGDKIQLVDGPHLKVGGVIDVVRK